MDSTDLFLTIIIFTVFVFLYIFNIFYIKYREIKRNWPKYKCQPIIMPFATFFGHDVNENFASCIGNMQGDLMGEFLKPLMSNIETIKSIGGDLTESLNNTTLLGSNLSLDQLTSFMSMTNVLTQVSNYIETMTKSFTKITDNVEKIGTSVAGIGTDMIRIPINIQKDPISWLAN